MIAGFSGVWRLKSPACKPRSSGTGTGCLASYCLLRAFNITMVPVSLPRELGHLIQQGLILRHFPGPGSPHPASCTTFARHQHRFGAAAAPPMTVDVKISICMYEWMNMDVVHVISM